MLQPFYTFLSALADLGQGGYNFVVRQPLVLLGTHGFKVRQMFLGLPRRQVVTVYAGLLWVIPIAMIQPYVSLYMVHLGFSEDEVGVYTALMNAAGLVCFFIGGYLADAWGRKKTLVFFDAFSWGGYCLALAWGGEKWFGVAAIFFMAAVSGSVTPYICLLAEGLSSKGRLVVFTVLQMG